MAYRGQAKVTKTGRKVWAVWNCPYCDTTGISGKYRECPNCGKPRGVHTQFSKGSSTEYLTQSEVSTHQEPDWLCECCDTYNSATTDICVSCNAPRGASKDYFQIKDDIESSKQGTDSFNGESEISEPTDYEESSSSQISDNSSNRKSPKSFRWLTNLIRFSVISVVVFLIGFLLVSVFKPVESEIQVLDKEWSRSISIEECTTVRGDGWDLPSGARVLDTESRLFEKDGIKILDHYDIDIVDVVKTRQVYVGDDVTYDYVDDGNGALDEIEIRTPIYEDEEYTVQEEVKTPVYRYEDRYETWYTYEEDKWLYSRSVETSGGSDVEPYWGLFTLGANERERSRNSSYEIQAICDGEEKVYNADYDTYSLIPVGYTLRVMVRPADSSIVDVLEVLDEDT